MSTNITPFPSRLREARQRRNLTQAELASRLGVTSNVIAHLEQGRSPNAFNVVRIARALNVSADYLLGLSELEDARDWPKGPLMQDIARLLQDRSDEELRDIVRHLREPDRANWGG